MATGSGDDWGPSNPWWLDWAILAFFLALMVGGSIWVYFR